MPPKPASCWHDTLDASADGPYCPGMHPPYDAHMSEACLSLNVFTPVAALHNASALPIFVWIYGGSLVLGSVASYGPIENLVTSGRAMLVAMNYRLGALGFAALPGSLPPIRAASAAISASSTSSSRSRGSPTTPPRSVAIPPA